jgi:hypothetical protein
VTLEKLMEMIKAAIGRSNIDGLFELLDRMLRDYKAEKGLNEPDSNLQEELDEARNHVLKLAQLESEHKSVIAKQLGEIDSLKKNLIEEKKTLNKELVGEHDRLESLGVELAQVTEELAKSEAALKKQREDEESKMLKLQELLDETSRQLGMKEQALKRHVVAKRIAESTAGKKIENYSPEELVGTLAEKMNKKELGAVAADLVSLMEDLDKTQLVVDVAKPLDQILRKKILADIMQGGIPQALLDDHFANMKQDALYSAILKVLGRLTDKAKRCDLWTLLMADFEEEEVKVIAGNFPESVKKSIVVDSLNALASTATARDSDDSSDSDKAEAKGKVIFDPSNDLTKRARRALLQKLFKRLPANEVKQISGSLGQKAKEALYRSVFEDHSAEDLKRGISGIIEKDCVQAIADGLSEDAVELLMPMLSERGGAIIARKSSKDLLDPSPKNRRANAVGVQTEIAGVGTSLTALDKDRHPPKKPEALDILGEDDDVVPSLSRSASPAPQSVRGGSKRGKRMSTSAAPPSFGKRKTRKTTVMANSDRTSIDESTVDGAIAIVPAEKTSPRDSSVSSQGTDPSQSPRSLRPSSKSSARPLSRQKTEGLAPAVASPIEEERRQSQPHTPPHIPEDTTSNVDNHGNQMSIEVDMNLL